jgi:hypothetical protein
VELGQLLDDRKADPQAAGASSEILPTLLKHFEDPKEHVRGDADSGVADPDLDMALAPF